MPKLDAEILDELQRQTKILLAIESSLCNKICSKTASCPVCNRPGLTKQTIDDKIKWVCSECGHVIE